MQNWTDEFAQTDPYLYRQKQNISIPLEDPNVPQNDNLSKGNSFLTSNITIVLPAYELCINGAK